MKYIKSIFASKKEIDRVVSSCFPQEVGWEFTLGCNMRCIHCGSKASPTRKRKNELTTKECLDVVHQMKELRVKRVVLSGGELFLRNDWNIVANEIADCGMTPGFVSNGFLINQKIARRLKNIRSKDSFIGISIDGDEKTHDAIRRMDSSFARATKALKILRENGVAASVVTQVNQLNFGVLDKIRDHILPYGIYAWQIQMALPFGRLDNRPDLVLDQSGYVKLAEYIVRQSKLYGDIIWAADCIGYYTDLEKTLRRGYQWQGCHAGINTFGLLSDGSVTGCLSLQDKRFIEGNVRKQRLKDIWFDTKRFTYNRNFKKTDLQGGCRDCFYGVECRAGCRNAAFSSTGLLFDNNYCIFRIRRDIRNGKKKNN